MASFKDLQQYANNRNVQAYLNMLMDAEGTSQYGNPYAVAGGGKVTLQDLSNIQNAFPKWGFKQTDGKHNVSTASGAFGFLGRTYDDLRRQGYEVKDFQPQTQRMAAIALLKNNGALPYVLRGDFDTAIKKSASTWASLPGSPYAQRTRNMAFVQNSLRKHLGDPNLTLNNYEQYTTNSPAMFKQPQQMEQLQNIFKQPTPQQVVNPYAELYNQRNVQQAQQVPQVPQDQQAPEPIVKQIDYAGMVDPDLERLIGEQYRISQNELWGM